MSFAIVRFIDEDGAPGIISTNWIVDSQTCKYPNVKMEYTKNKLLLSRCEPSVDWITCPIKVLKTFSSYQLAKNRLSDAEDTSALESCLEDTDDAMKRRCRKKKCIRLPGEDSSDDDGEDYDTYTASKRSKMIDYPLPPPTTHTSTRTAYTPSVTPLVSNPQLIPQVSNSRGEDFSNDEDCHTSSSSTRKNMIDYPFPPPTTPKTAYTPVLTALFSSPTQSTPQILNSTGNRQERDIKQLKMNQNMMWELLNEYGKINTRLDNIEQKLDTLIATKCNKDSISSLPEDLLNVLASMPVGPEQFNGFDELLSNNHLFRKELIRILLCVGGKDVKSLAASLLRKVIADEAAEKFTLTGKCRNGPIKQSFEKTKLYTVIQDVCLRKFKTSTEEQKLREAISDWLMQAKFRRTRRESRKEKNKEGELNLADVA